MTKLLSVAVLALALVAQAVEAANKYPIVLVHGMMGWNTGEFLNLPYWGTLQGNFVEKLRAQGHTVYTVGVGKLSSDWDRAIDAYYQIKGGQVDYGINHSKVSGHARFGRNYTGLFPQWGTVVNGELQKVHLMGHSMGGTTIRMLAGILNKGVARSPTPEDPKTNDLFAGGKDWVHSITTISSPNQGSTLCDIIITQHDLVESVAGAAFSIIGSLGDFSKALFDPVMDQWGIANKKSGETIEDYVNRIIQSKLFAQGYHDNAGYSLSLAGAKEQNNWVGTLPNVYYYSFVTEASYDWRDPFLNRIALPDPRFALPTVYPLVTLLGSRVTSLMGLPDSWLPNDGFVNVPSQINDGIGPVVNFAGVSKRGTWVTFKTLGVDHLGVIGMNPAIPMYSVFKSHFSLVADLPTHEAAKSRRELGEDQGHVAPLEIVREVLAAVNPIALENQKPISSV